ncbi:MAG: nicotinate phosphoribosyltransferase [Phycisphaerales bacterium]|nr:nicotinate phosphoribosyltransferase [Phycisphaerales bacterium]
MISSLQLYDRPLGLMTDLYQITMVHGYWKLKMTEREAVFHLAFRQHPFDGGFTVACGLGGVIDFVRGLRFGEDDLAYLATLCGDDGKPLFENDFLKYLGELKFTCDVDAVEEGTIVFPHEPLVRVQGPLLQCQLLETAFLNQINFASLVATKAARICLAAHGEPVLEFGLRRAQGMDGAVTASRAAYIGGCAATSNALAGKIFGIPVKGTHAHSWVMCFANESEAFDAYAQAMPNNCVFLVDTYDTLDGVRNAVKAGKKLCAKGRKLQGIRLDSGDLAYLSIEARKILDKAGFQNAAIIASNDLDEDIIRSLKEQGATIGVWGVGTKLATAYEQPALGGVFKLSAIRQEDGNGGEGGMGGGWLHKIKLSEQLAKTSIPGILQVRRFKIANEFRADMIFDQLTSSTPSSAGGIIVDPVDDTRRKTLPSHATTEDLLVPIFRGGNLVYTPPTLETTRKRLQDQLAAFHPGIKRVVNPHEYPVGLEKNLYDLRHKMILQARGVPE